MFRFKKQVIAAMVVIFCCTLAGCETTKAKAKWVGNKIMALDDWFKEHFW